MTMPSLFDAPATRTTDPQTSRDAAARVAPFRSSLRSRILDALVRPMTDDELCAALGEPVRRWPSVKTARSALYGLHKVRWTGRERNGQREWQAWEQDVDVAGDVL